MNRAYYNPTTGQTATTDSNKADKNGNIWVSINGGEPTLINYSNFVKQFNSIILMRKSNDKYNQS